MHKKVNSTVVCGVLFLIISILLLTVVYPNQIIVKGREIVSSDFFPKLCAYSLLILSIWFLAAGSRDMVMSPVETDRNDKPSPQEKVIGAKRKISPIVWTIAICLACICAIQLFGFMVVCFAFLAFSFKKGGMQTWWKPPLVSALVTIVLYLVFRTLMLIILPKGVLTSLVLNMFK